MSSYDYGKAEVCEWIRSNYPADASALDVGACDGKWRGLLPEYVNLDAVEVYGPNLKFLTDYRNVYHADIRGFEYEWYDLIIFGDIIEHMTVEDAQKVLDYARTRCRDMIVAVPFLYKQGPLYGNRYEIHVQYDLTARNFTARYPGFDVLCNPGHAYCYYHKGADS